MVDTLTTMYNRNKHHDVVFVKELIPHDTPIVGIFRMWNGCDYQIVKYRFRSKMAFWDCGNLPDFEKGTEVYVPIIEEEYASWNSHVEGS